MSIDVSFWFKDCKKLTIKDRFAFGSFLSTQFLCDYKYHLFFRDFILSVDDLGPEDNFYEYWHFLTEFQQNHLSIIYLSERIEQTKIAMSSFEEALAQFQDSQIIDKVA